MNKMELMFAVEKDGEKLLAIKFNHLVEDCKKFNNGKSFGELSERSQIMAFDAIKGTMKKCLDYVIMRDVRASKLFNEEELDTIHRSLKISMDVMLIAFEVEMYRHFNSKPSMAHAAQMHRHNGFMNDEAIRQHNQYVHDEAVRQHMEFAQNSCMQAMHDSMSACNMHMNMF